MDLANLTPSDLEAAIRNSGYDFNSHIIDAECVDSSDVVLAIYEIAWDVSSTDSLVTFCNTLYITEQDGKIYADI